MLDVQMMAAGQLIVTAAVWITAYLAGVFRTDRKHRRQNAATAQCAACNWESDPVPLADAFTAAARHTATPAANGTDRHHGFVVKAW